MDGEALIVELSYRLFAPLLRLTEAQHWDSLYVSYLERYPPVLVKARDRRVDIRGRQSTRGVLWLPCFPLDKTVL